MKYLEFIIVVIEAAYCEDVTGTYLVKKRIEFQKG